MVDGYRELSKPPLNLLLRIGIKGLRRPWEVRIDELLERLIDIVYEAGTPDFRLCGSALLNASLIYRMKVESLFKVERRRVVKAMDRGSLEPPSILELPFRFELRSIDLDSLIDALESLLSGHGSSPKKRIEERALEPIEFDDFYTDIVERVESFKVSVLQALEGRERLGMREYTQGMDLREVVRIFIILLFLAQEGVILLEEDGEDLVIRRPDGDEGDIED